MGEPIFLYDGSSDSAFDDSLRHLVRGVDRERRKRIAFAVADIFAEAWASTGSQERGRMALHGLSLDEILDKSKAIKSSRREVESGSSGDVKYTLYEKRNEDDLESCQLG